MRRLTLPTSISPLALVAAESGRRDERASRVRQRAAQRVAQREEEAGVSFMALRLLSRQRTREACAALEDDARDLRREISAELQREGLSEEEVAAHRVHLRAGYTSALPGV